MIYNYLIGRKMLETSSEDMTTGIIYENGVITYIGSILHTIHEEITMKKIIKGLSHIILFDNVRLLISNRKKRWDMIIHHFFTCVSMYHYSLFSKNIDISFPKNIASVEAVSSFPLSYHIMNQKATDNKHLRLIFKVSMPFIFIWRTQKLTKGYMKGVLGNNLNRNEKIVQGVCGSGIVMCNLFWIGKICSKVIKK